MSMAPAHRQKSSRRGSGFNLPASLALTCALGLASCLWRTRWSFTTPCVQWPRAVLGQHARTKVSRHASPEEDKVLQLVAEYPVAERADTDDVEEMVKAAKKLMRPFIDQGAYSLLPGDWKLEWSTGKGRAFLRPGEGEGPTKYSPSGKSSKDPANLQLLSFLALPKTIVQLTGSYNRIDQDRYQRVETFRMHPDYQVSDTTHGTEAALVLEGPWGTGTAEGEWGKGAERTRVPVQFQQIRVVPSTENSEESRTMIEKLGLGSFLERQTMKTQETYVDLNYMSPVMRIHKEASGDIHVLSKMEPGTIPFLLD
eukprot:TRINITY_DN7572_c0_g1_i1.p1 TRINITY_DN7572_c0_g1~~TRINITY_DN7572_c0_g1_i1.p1  ORF type:complete len:312 (+),score=45.81 TRINITY_DN7572_c0_g1_i1:68-1003(+)